MNIIINNSGNRSLIEKLIELLPNVSVLREEDYKNNLDEYLSDVRDFIKYGCSYYPTNDNDGNRVNKEKLIYKNKINIFECSLELLKDLRDSIKIFITGSSDSKQKEYADYIISDDTDINHLINKLNLNN